METSRMLVKLIIFAIWIGLSKGAQSTLTNQLEARSLSRPVVQTPTTDLGTTSGVTGSNSGETVQGVYGGQAGTQGQFQQPSIAQPSGYAVYGNNGHPSNNQIFGLSSNGDLTLSAYFGPVFWGCATGLILGFLVLWIVNLIGGFEYLGKAIGGLGSGKKGGSGKAKSLDLDQLTSLVYSAMDKYNKWNLHDQKNL